MQLYSICLDLICVAYDREHVRYVKMQSLRIKIDRYMLQLLSIAVPGTVYSSRFIRPGEEPNYRAC